MLPRRIACLYDHTEFTPILYLDLIGSIMGRDVGPLPPAPRGESELPDDSLHRPAARTHGLNPISCCFNQQGERLAAYMIVALQLANVLPAYLMITTRTSASLHPTQPPHKRYTHLTKLSQKQSSHPFFSPPT